MELAEKLRDLWGYQEEDEYYDEDDGAENLIPDKSDPITYGKNKGEEVAEVVLVKPQETEDAKAIADHLSNNHIVILNLETVSKEVSRRLIDFLVGAAYAKSGQVKRIANNTYVILPYNVGYSDDMLG